MEQDKYLNGSIREIDPAWADEVHERKCHLQAVAAERDEVPVPGPHGERLLQAVAAARDEDHQDHDEVQRVARPFGRLNRLIDGKRRVLTNYNGPRTPEKPAKRLKVAINYV